jgi:hypothetical protein
VSAARIIAFPSELHVRLRSDLRDARALERRLRASVRECLLKLAQRRPQAVAQ